MGHSEHSSIGLSCSQIRSNGGSLTDVLGQHTYTLQRCTNPLRQPEGFQRASVSSSSSDRPPDTTPLCEVPSDHLNGDQLLRMAPSRRTPIYTSGPSGLFGRPGPGSASLRAVNHNRRLPGSFSGYRTAPWPGAGRTASRASLRPPYGNTARAVSSLESFPQGRGQGTQNTSRRCPRDVPRCLRFGPRILKERCRGAPYRSVFARRGVGAHEVLMRLGAGRTCSGCYRRRVCQDSNVTVLVAQDSFGGNDAWDAMDF